jgi:hypothetical protein
MERPNKCSVCGIKCDGWMCDTHTDHTGGDKEEPAFIEEIDFYDYDYGSD